MTYTTSPIDSSSLQLLLNTAQKGEGVNVLFMAHAFTKYEGVGVGLWGWVRVPSSLTDTIAYTHTHPHPRFAILIDVFHIKPSCKTPETIVLTHISYIYSFDNLCHS
jgi:hypothetical protein